MLEHPIHDEQRRLRNQYTAAVEDAKTTCWMAWLENTGAGNIWEISQFISQPTLDGGRARIPDLIVKMAEQQPKRIQDNKEKGKVFQAAFFPSKPMASAVPSNIQYPPPA